MNEAKEEQAITGEEITLGKLTEDGKESKEKREGKERESRRPCEGTRRMHCRDSNNFLFLFVDNK